MLLFNVISKSKRFLAGCIVLILIFNYTFKNWLINSGFQVTFNQEPFGFGPFTVLKYALLLCISYGLFYFEIWSKFPWVGVLIVAGVLSNFLEYYFNSKVVDYIDLKIAVLNLADIHIYGGLLLLYFNISKTNLIVSKTTEYK